MQATDTEIAGVTQELKDAKIIWIRHAHSQAQVSFENSPPGDLSTYTDPSLRDCSLSEKGFAMIEASPVKAFLQGVKIDYVFVSPLKRTMQTAYNLFKDHEDFQNLQFELEPLIREHLHCSSDVASDYPKIISLAKSFFPHVIAEEKWARYQDPWKWQAEDQLPEVYQGILKCIEANGGDVCKGIFQF